MNANPMSYIIIAEVDTTREENMHGDFSKVNASVLSERNGFISFDVPCKFYEAQQRTKALCESLIDAGFVAFAVSHSY
jgi:hypothetical protein